LSENIIIMAKSRAINNNVALWNEGGVIIIAEALPVLRRILVRIIFKGRIRILGDKLRGETSRV